MSYQSVCSWIRYKVTTVVYILLTMSMRGHVSTVYMVSCVYLCCNQWMDWIIAVPLFFCFFTLRPFCAPNVLFLKLKSFSGEFGRKNKITNKIELNEFGSRHQQIVYNKAEELYSIKGVVQQFGKCALHSCSELGEQLHRTLISVRWILSYSLQPVSVSLARLLVNFKSAGRPTLFPLNWSKLAVSPVFCLCSQLTCYLR